MKITPTSHKAVASPDTCKTFPDEAALARKAEKMKYALLICFVGLFAATLYDGLPDVQACSPPYGDSINRSVIPADKASNIPPNVLVSVSYDSTIITKSSFTVRKDALYLANASGDRVESTVTLVEQSNYPIERTIFLIKPKQELAKKTEYFVYSQLSTSDCIGDQIKDIDTCKYEKHTVISSFTTGSESDNTAPTLPDGTQITCAVDECNGGNCCGPYKRINIHMGWKKATDNHFNEYLRYNVYDSENPGTPIAARIDLTHVQSFIYVSGMALTSSGLTIDLPASEKYIVRAVDIAGNEDGNTNKVGLPLGCKQARLENAGCSTSGATFHGELLLYFFMLASLLWLRIK